MKNINNFISVIINTYNRPLQCIEAIQSILKNEYNKFEIIIVEQCGNKQIPNFIKSAKISNKVKYFNLQVSHVSKAKNYGINQARGRIIVFTDDDCLVDKNWLKEINLAFKKNGEIVGILGQITPYTPKKNLGKVCPIYFKSKKPQVFSDFTEHWKIGFGCNMAFKKNAFNEAGMFKTWLGSGSIASNAEDAEFMLRLLLINKKLLYTPRIKVFHNRWLTPQEFKVVYFSYLRGQAACYGYFALKNVPLAKTVVKNDFKKLFTVLTQSLKDLVARKKKAYETFHYSLCLITVWIIGLVIGVRHSLSKL